MVHIKKKILKSMGPWTPFQTSQDLGLQPNEGKVISTSG